MVVGVLLVIGLAVAAYVAARRRLTRVEPVAPVAPAEATA
jgi:hypothetical protein